MSNSTPTRGLPGGRETARGNEGAPAEARATGTMERRRFLAAAAAAAAAGGLDPTALAGTEDPGLRASALPATGSAVPQTPPQE
ncbi:MAG: hypothetical protein F4086_08785, partial [Gemmatimonadetes bacterium]|nr:hypothetical protein [Gemmatimonadota bacterium]